MKPTDWPEQVERCRSRHADYDAVMDEVRRDNVDIPESIAHFIFALPEPAEIIYFLASHREYAREVVELSVEDAQVELKKLAQFLFSGVPL